MIDRLFKAKPIPILPSHESRQFLAADFNCYFSAKIQTLNDNMQGFCWTETACFAKCNAILQILIINT